MITESPVSLRTQDGLLVGRCSPCGLVLQQHEDFDRDIALGTFLQHHPQSPLAIHRPVTPAGWGPVAQEAS
jgi:hypothetical protein